MFSFFFSYHPFTLDFILVNLSSFFPLTLLMWRSPVTTIFLNSMPVLCFLLIQYLRSSWQLLISFSWNAFLTWSSWYHSPLVSYLPSAKAREHGDSPLSFSFSCLQLPPLSTSSDIPPTRGWVLNKSLYPWLLFRAPYSHIQLRARYFTYICMTNGNLKLNIHRTEFFILISL